MQLLDLIPAAWRQWVLVLALAVFAIFFFRFGGLIESGRYVQKEAESAAQQAKDEKVRMDAVLADLRSAQEKSRALALRVQANDETHQKELDLVQKNTKLLTDRLATSDLRLSVLLAGNSPAASGQQLSAVAGAGGVVHAGARAELDPAHAQRIVGITGDGDEGLTALAACQGYVKEILKNGSTPAQPVR